MQRETLVAHTPALLRAQLPRGCSELSFPNPESSVCSKSPRGWRAGTSPSLTSLFSSVEAEVVPVPLGGHQGRLRQEDPGGRRGQHRPLPSDSRPARGHCPASAHDSVWVFFPVFPSYHTDMFPSLFPSGVSVMLCWTRAVTFLQKQPSSALHQLRSEARSLHLFLFNEQSFLQEGEVAAEASRTS